jgi:adenosine deaminase
MIDLHLHLDGSLSIDDFKYLSKINNVDLGTDFPNCVYVPNDCKSLEEYLLRFDLPLKLLQNKESISYSVKSLVSRLANMGYVYGEIRFAPLLHLQQGLTQHEVVEAAVFGLKEGLKENSEFDANLILCCMRHASEDLNIETIEVANTFKNNKVCAVDLAGAEALHDCNYFSNVFSLVRKYNLNITIHAGEATGSDEIVRAVNLGAKRIGHGVHLSLDKETVELMKKHHICFEFCPTSNLQTKSLKSYQDVPLRKFLRRKIAVTINSDNMTVSNTDAILEMKRMKETFKLSNKMIERILLTSVEHSFITSKEKELLKNKILKKVLK